MFWRPYQPPSVTREQLKNTPNVMELSKADMFLASLNRILREDYGFIKSVEQNKALDSNSNVLPLYTYPAIEYLLQFDYSEMNIFEYGAGYSTIFWMERAKRVVSIENDKSWYESMKARVNERVSLQFEPGPNFPGRINDGDGDSRFDVIIIDGSGYRYDCAVEATGRLAAGGMIILDNSDWHHHTAEYLRTRDLIQIDMTGFKPAEPYASTTSLFLDRKFAFPLSGDRQPKFGMGAKRLHSSAWDKPQRP